MSRLITFEEFSKIVDNAVAVILDHNAVSYPCVETDMVIINYETEDGTAENEFYEEDKANIYILDDGSIQYNLEYGESYNIQILQVEKLS